MRRIKLAVVALLFLLGTGPSRAGDPGKPIIQNPARLQQHYADLLEWNRESLAGAYDRVGKKDPKWDKQAREALDLIARRFSQQVDPIITIGAIDAQLKAAMDAGCDDPLILYFHVRSSAEIANPGPPEFERRMKVASTAMVASAYPPIRRAVAIEKYEQSRTDLENLSPEERKEAARSIDDAIALFPRSFAEDKPSEPWAASWYETILWAINGHRKLGGDAVAAAERVDAQLAKIPKAKALRLQARGRFLIDHAWEARGTGFSNAVGEENFRKFEERMAEARKVLKQAWDTKPGDGRTANLMLYVEKGIGGGDRVAMETWFSRAIEANGNDQDACWSKLDWLDPKWYGNLEDMLAFGKACRETKNWRSGITLLIGEAHLRARIGLSGEAGAAYLKTPEVWGDIRAVSEEYLTHFPDDPTARSKYAALCYLCAHYDEAHKQFQVIGDKLVGNFNFPVPVLERMRADAAVRVASVPGKKP